ncbi:Hypothetical predicted protein, partial [Marmota monax]
LQVAHNHQYLKYYYQYDKGGVCAPGTRTVTAQDTKAILPLFSLCFKSHSTIATPSSTPQALVSLPLQAGLQTGPTAKKDLLSQGWEKKKRDRHPGYAQY